VGYQALYSFISAVFELSPMPRLPSATADLVKPVAVLATPLVSFQQMSDQLKMSRSVQLAENR
jgi:hypothetical protein